MVVTVAAVAASATCAQASSSASANATARFVDPVGVGSVAEPAVVPVARAGGEAQAMTAGSFAVLGPKDQTYSVETTARPVLKGAGGPGELRLDVTAARNGAGIRLHGRLAGAETAPAGLYAGQLATVVNFN